MYKLIILPRAEKQLEALPRKDADAVARKIESLRQNPRPSAYKKLSGYESIYRIRHGNYRVVYSIENNTLIITIIKVAHRKDVYK